MVKKARKVSHSLLALVISFVMVVSVATPAFAESGYTNGGGTTITNDGGTTVTTDGNGNNGTYSGTNTEGSNNGNPETNLDNNGNNDNNDNNGNNGNNYIGGGNNGNDEPAADEPVNDEVIADEPAADGDVPTEDYPILEPIVPIEARVLIDQFSAPVFVPSGSTLAAALAAAPENAHTVITLDGDYVHTSSINLTHGREIMILLNGHNLDVNVTNPGGAAVQLNGQWDPNPLMHRATLQLDGSGEVNINADAHIALDVWNGAAVVTTGGAVLNITNVGTAAGERRGIRALLGGWVNIDGDIFVDGPASSHSQGATGIRARGGEVGVSGNVIVSGDHSIGIWVHQEGNYVWVGGTVTAEGYGSHIALDWRRPGDDSTLGSGPDTITVDGLPSLTVDTEIIPMPGSGSGGGGGGGGAQAVAPPMASTIPVDLTRNRGASPQPGSEAFTIAAAMGAIGRAMPGIRSSASNTTTAESILSVIQSAIPANVQADWSAPNSFRLVPATATRPGSITGTIRISFGNSASALQLNMVIPAIESDTEE